MAKMVSDRAHIAMDIVSDPESDHEQIARARDYLRTEITQTWDPTDDMGKTESRLHDAYWSIMQREVSAAENAISSARQMCYMVLTAVGDDDTEPMSTIRWMAKRWLENHGKDWMQEGKES